MKNQYNLIVSNDWVKIPFTVLIQVAQARLRAGDVVIYCAPENPNDVAKHIAMPFMADRKQGMLLLQRATIMCEPSLVLQAVQLRRERNPTAKIHLCIDAPQETNFDRVKNCFRSGRFVSTKIFSLDSLNEAAGLVDGITVFVRL